MLYEMSCSNKPLNGLPFGGNTEGGRLQREIMRCSENYVIGKASSPYCCPPYKKTIQAEITSAESNRISDLAQGCVRGVAQDRIQQLLSGPRSFRSQSVRIAAIQQAVLTCSPQSTVPIPIITEQCPPLPPPPGPPYICSPSRLANY
jgi:hypothetical protein